MRSKIVVASILAAVAALSCKPRQSKSDAKASDEGPGFDVNDVSILFDKTGPGTFYPNIDVNKVWPFAAFSDLIEFARDGKRNGVKFGQFLVPTNYAAFITKFLAKPDLLPSDTDPVQKAAKEIADGIIAKQIKCTAQTNQPLLCIDQAAKITFTNHRDALLNVNNWRIVGMRMDLCAGAHKADISEQCEVEFRLIAQPFGDFPPVPPPPGAPLGPNGTRPPSPPLTTKPNDQKAQGPFMFDASAHLIYKIGILDLNTKRIKTPNGRSLDVQDIIDDLQNVKNASHAKTNLHPLGVHPGLKKDSDGALAAALETLIYKYAGRGGRNLTNVTSMQLSGPVVFDSSVWVFFQGEVDENSHWNPTPITGSESIWSIRTQSVKGVGGKMVPPPQLQNSRLSINGIFDFGPGAAKPLDKVTKLPQDIADLPSFFDNPGRYGDPSLKVNGVEAASVKNSDCISCHMTATRSFEWGIRNIDSTGRKQPSLYTPPVGTTAYLHPDVVPRVDYSLRNFGYFLPPPIETPDVPGGGLAVFNFAGPRTEQPAIMPRVVYESAELVNMINSRFLGVENPGLLCQGEDSEAALRASTSNDPFDQDAQKNIRRKRSVHAKISDCLLHDQFKTGFSKAGQCYAACRGEDDSSSDDESDSTVSTPGVSQLNPGLYVTDVSASVAASRYFIDHIHTFESGAGIATWRMEDFGSQSSESLSDHRVHFECKDAAGSSCKLSGNTKFSNSTTPDKIQIIDANTIRCTFSGTSFTYKLQSTNHP